MNNSKNKQIIGLTKGTEEDTAHETRTFLPLQEKDYLRLSAMLTGIPAPKSKSPTQATKPDFIFSLVFQSILADRADIFEELFQCGFDLGRMEQDEVRSSFLNVAASQRKMVVLDFLLRNTHQYLNPEAALKQKKQVLQSAIQFGHTDILEVLLKTGYRASNPQKEFNQINEVFIFTTPTQKIPILQLFLRHKYLSDKALLKKLNHRNMFQLAIQGQKYEFARALAQGVSLKILDKLSPANSHKHLTRQEVEKAQEIVIEAQQHLLSQNLNPDTASTANKKPKTSMKI